MRSTIIPAQITTIEDTIAGNLTLTQILLLLSPVLFTASSYVLLPERMSFTSYKIPLILLVSLFFVVMSVRIKSRLVLSWSIILLAYFFRPKLYLFDKNSNFLREFNSYVVPVNPISQTGHDIKETRKKNDGDGKFDFQTIARNTEVNLRFTKKGVFLINNL